MSYTRIWRFQATAGREQEFAAAYGPEGDWARLFQRSPGYLRTEMARLDPGDVFLITGRWASRKDWDDFLAAHGEAYHALDRAFAPLCAQETELDEYEMP
jgi:heme-degrading monooxygenase HmoA